MFVKLVPYLPNMVIAENKGKVTMFLHHFGEIYFCFRKVKSQDMLWGKLNKYMNGKKIFWTKHDFSATEHPNIGFSQTAQHKHLIRVSQY